MKPVSDSRKNMNEKIMRLKDAITMNIERKLQLKKRTGNHRTGREKT